MSAIGRSERADGDRTWRTSTRPSDSVHRLMRKLDRDSRDAMRGDRERSPDLKRKASDHAAGAAETPWSISCPCRSVDGRDAAVPVAGGSCLNIAVGMARLGAPAGFVGGISTDLFGRMIADHALTSQVDLRYATRSEHQTTLAFVRHAGGEPQYAFYDEATASRNWTLSAAAPSLRSRSRRSMSDRRRSPTTRAANQALGDDRRRAAARPPSPSIRTAGPTWCGTRRRYVEQHGHVRPGRAHRPHVRRRL